MNNTLPIPSVSELICSKYVDTFSKTSSDVLVFDELQRIKLGYYKDVIENCRHYYQSGNLLEYKKCKSKLPALTFSGIFCGAHKKENLTNYTNLITIDLDNVGENLVHSKLILSNDPHTFALWISPSGNGLKVLIRTNCPAYFHKHIFDQIVDYYLKTYNLSVDLSGSDVCRLCYVSYDEQLILNVASEIFNLESDIENNQLEKNIVLKKTTDNTTSLTQTDRSKLFATEGKNKGANRLLIIKIIKFLKANKKSITSTYECWYKVAIILANSFTHDLGEKYFLQLCECDGLAFDPYKSKYMLDYCYRNKRDNELNFASLVFLAKQQGFTILKISAKRQDEEKGII